MGFVDMDVWKRSERLSADIYRVLSGLRDYGFKDQITRSGLSIPSNIAEGMERDYARDCVRFLRIAKGSCGELQTQIYIGMDIEYIDRDLGKSWLSEAGAISSMLGGLIRSKQKQITKGEIEP